MNMTLEELYSIGHLYGHPAFRYKHPDYRARLKLWCDKHKAKVYLRKGRSFNYNTIVMIVNEKMVEQRLFVPSTINDNETEYLLFENNLNAMYAKHFGRKVQRKWIHK